jgi:hypothetical protein
MAIRRRLSVISDPNTCRLSLFAPSCALFLRSTCIDRSSRPPAVCVQRTTGHVLDGGLFYGPILVRFHTCRTSREGKSTLRGCEICSGPLLHLCTACKSRCRSNSMAESSETFIFHLCTARLTPTCSVHSNGRCR